MNTTTSPPAQWSRENRATFLDLLYRHGNAARAAHSVGLSRQSAYALRKRDAAFAAEWEEAILDAHDLFVDELSLRAVEGVEKPLPGGGTRMVQDSRLIIATVKRLDRIAERREDREERALIRQEDRDERAVIREENRAEREQVRAERHAPSPARDMNTLPLASDDMPDHVLEMSTTDNRANTATAQETIVPNTDDTPQNRACASTDPAHADDISHSVPVPCEGSGEASTLTPELEDRIALLARVRMMKQGNAHAGYATGTRGKKRRR
jgi:hypothetical protein